MHSNHAPPSTHVERVRALKITKNGLILCCKIFVSQSSMTPTGPSAPQKEAAEASTGPSAPQEEAAEELRESTEQEIPASPRARENSIFVALNL